MLYIEIIKVRDLDVLPNARYTQSHGKWAEKDRNFAVTLTIEPVFMRVTREGVKIIVVINGIIPEITEAEISGEIKLNDMRLNEMDIAQRSRYISTVYQNPKTQFYCVESTDELAFPLENRNLPKDEMVKIIKK